MKNLKVYKAECDYRYGFGIAVVAAYNQRQVRKLVNDHVKNLNWSEFERTLVSELPELAPTITEPGILVWGHHVE